MKNFSKIEEQQLITKIWKVHDEIFSLPAKRYVFAIINQIMCSGAAFAYDYLSQVKNVNITIIRNIRDFDKFKFEFGDRLIIVYCQSGLETQNDFTFKKYSINDIYPKHDSIIITTDFFNQSEFAMLYRETIMEYQYNNHQKFPKISGMYAFEYLAKNLEE